MTDRASNRLGAGAATAVAQVLSMVGSSILGLLIARELGSSGATDGFFAANTVYGIALFAAQSLRTTAPASLIDRRHGSFAAHVRSVAVLAAAALLLFAVVAAASDVLLPDAAARTLRTALLILAPAAVAQLYGGLFAARCAVLGSFALPALAYALGTIVMALAFVALKSSLGVDAIPTAVALGALLSAGAMALIWRRAEASAPDPAAEEASAPRVRSLTGRLLRGAVPILASQVVISVSTFAAGHTGSGNGTLYTYGMLAVAVLTAVVASPVSIVLAADVARTWDRRPSTLSPLVLGTFRLGAALLPALAIPTLLLGPPPARFVMTALSYGDVDQVFLIASILTPVVLATLLSMVPLVGTIAADTVGRAGLWSFVVAATHAVAAVLVANLGSLTGLAVESFFASIALSAVPVVVALRGEALPVIAGAFRVTGLVALPGPAAALATWLALGGTTSFETGAAATMVGLLVHLVAVWSFARQDVLALLPTRLRRRTAS